MWLLDANMDVHLVAVLADLGISSATAARGWVEGVVERQSGRSGFGRWFCGPNLQSGLSPDG